MRSSGQLLNACLCSDHSSMCATGCCLCPGSRLCSCPNLRSCTYMRSCSPMCSKAYLPCSSCTIMCSGCFELCTILCSKAILPWWIVSSSRLSLEVSPLGDCNRVEQLSSTVLKLAQSSLCRRTIFTEPSPLGCFFRYSRYAGRTVESTVLLLLTSTDGSILNDYLVRVVRACVTECPCNGDDPIVRRAGVRCIR